MDYLRKALRGTSIVFLMGIIGSILSYITLVYLARFLGPHDYGLFSAVLAFVTFFLFFRDFGLPQALTKYIAEYETEGKRDYIKTVIVAVLSFELLSSFFFVFLFYLLRWFLADSYFKDPLAVNILVLLLFYIIGSTFFGTFKDILLGFQEMFIFSLSEVIKNILIFLGVILFLSFGYGVFGPAIAYASAILIASLILLPFVLQRMPFFSHKIIDFLPISKKVILFSIPVFATAFGSRIIASVDTLMLTYFRTLPEVGIYNAILPSSSIIAHVFSGALASVVFPLSAELWYKNDVPRIVQGMQLLYKYVFVIMAPFTFILVVFADFFIDLFFGLQYFPGMFAFQILLIGMFFFTVASINHNVLSGIGKPFEVTKIIFLAAFLNFVLNLILIPLYGISGAAFSTFISYITTLVLSTKKVSTSLNTPVPYLQWLKVGLAILIFLSIAFLVKWSLTLNHWLEFFVAGFISTTAYALFIYWFNIINIPEIKKFIHRVK